MLKLKKVEDVLLFSTLLFLPTQLGKHFWPGFSYIYSLKIDYLSPTVYFWDILVIILLLVWIISKPKVHKAALSLFFFFLLTQILSLVKAENFGAGLVRLEQYTIAGFFGVYLASYDFKVLSKKIFLPLALGVLGEALIAFFQFIKGSTLSLWVLGERSFNITTPGIAKFDFYGFQFLRPYATFPHPNVLAGYMLVTIIIVLSFWGAERHQNLNLTCGGFWTRRLARMTWLAGLFLGSFTIFLTMSRTVILAGFISLILLFRKKGLLFVLFFVLVLSPILFARFSSLINFDNLTVLRREDLLGSAWQIFVKSPIIGIGINNFIPEVANNLVSGPSRFLQPVHNIFFLELAETGIMGLVGFILFLGYPIKRIVNCQLSIVNLLPWGIILFLGLFDHYFLTLPQGYRLLFLVWGLSLSMLK